MWDDRVPAGCRPRAGAVCLRTAFPGLLGDPFGSKRPRDVLQWVF